MALGIIQEMKSLLNSLPHIPRHRRSDVFHSFRTLNQSLEEKLKDFDQEIKKKTENLLWFFELVTLPQFDSLDLTDSHLGWPNVLLDSIHRRILKL